VKSCVGDLYVSLPRAAGEVLSDFEINGAVPGSVVWRTIVIQFSVAGGEPGAPRCCRQDIDAASPTVIAKKAVDGESAYRRFLKTNRELRSIAGGIGCGSGDAPAYHNRERKGDIEVGYAIRAGRYLSQANGVWPSPNPVGSFATFAKNSIRKEERESCREYLQSWCLCRLSRPNKHRKVLKVVCANVAVAMIIGSNSSVKLLGSRSMPRRPFEKSSCRE